MAGAGSTLHGFQGIGHHTVNEARRQTDDGNCGITFFPPPRPFAWSTPAAPESVPAMDAPSLVPVNNGIGLNLRSLQSLWGT